MRKIKENELVLNEATTKLLPEAVQKEYEVVGLLDYAGKSRLVFPGFERFKIDFKTLTISKAQKLLDAKFPFLRKKEVKDTKAVKPAK